MSEAKKKTTISANVTPEFVEQYKAHVATLPGDWDRSTRAKALLEADMDCGDLLAIALQRVEKELLRKELSVVLYVLLASVGRVPSSDVALTIVKKYLAGQYHDDDGGD